jgi:sulfur carrier protein ThiS
LVVTVHLHTTLQRQSPDGRVNQLAIELPEGVVIEEVLQSLAIHLDREVLILVLNHRIADANTTLSNGDRLDIVPAISGG